MVIPLAPVISYSACSAGRLTGRGEPLAFLDRRSYLTVRKGDRLIFPIVRGRLGRRRRLPIGLALESPPRRGFLTARVSMLIDKADEKIIPGAVGEQLSSHGVALLVHVVRP